MTRRTKSGRALNYHRSLRRPNIKYYKASLWNKFKLPQSIDLRPQDSPIFNQGTEGSCTANAACGLADFLEIKKGLNANPFANPQEYIKGEFEAASRNFVYWNERAILGTKNQDSGAFLHNGAQVFNQWGAPSEDNYPYGSQTLFAYPGSEMYGIAYHHKVKTIQQIQDGDIQTVQSVLASGYPVMFGMPVYQEFEDLNPENYLLPLPTPFEQELGGHANVWVGYDGNGNFWGRNSWGAQWGLNGYYLMPFEYAATLCSDLWFFQ